MHRFFSLAKRLALVALLFAPMTAHSDALTSGHERVLQLGSQQLVEIPEGVVRLAIGDDSVVGVQLQKSLASDRATQLILTPNKIGQTSLIVWPQGGVAPLMFQLKVLNPVSSSDSHHSLSEHAHARTLSGKDVQLVDASRVQLKSNVVQVDVKVVELNKSRMQQAGLNLFSTSSNSHGFQFGLLSTGSAINSNLTTAGMLSADKSSPFVEAFGLLMNFSKARIGLNWGVLEGAGMAKVLAEPSLVAISGQSANFLAGGEIPIPMAQGNGSISIEYKAYGVGLTVSPTVLDNQRIVLKVAPESSELDYANAVNLQSVAVPAITTRRADTTVELGDGESFVIGGLVTQSITSMVNRVPLLGHIPILGTLFKRQEFLRKDRELVIVVTPHLVKPIAADVPLDKYLPGAEQTRNPAPSFWGSYLGVNGRPNALPGFSQ